MNRIRTANDIVDRYPSYAEHLSEDDPLYQLWEKAWHAPKDLFGEEEGFPVLRTGLKAKMKYIIVRPEYAQAYSDIRSIYIDVVKDKIVTVPRTTDGPEKFTLGDACKELCIDDEYHPTESRASALIVTGQPGIGKTMFLSYILVRRLAIRKFVIYQVQPSTFHIFHDRGVTSIKSDSMITPEDLQYMLPHSTWCLIGSNWSANNPPPFVLNFHQFIVQATSPLKKDWCEKAGVACDHYIMKPMSLHEIELSWGCLQRHSTNIESIGDYYTHFGPSTQGALFSHKQWKTKLEHAFEILGSSVLLLEEIIQDLTCIIDHYPEVSSTILLLTPGEYRDKPHVEVITEHVMGLLQSAGIPI